MKTLRDRLDALQHETVPIQSKTKMASYDSNKKLIFPTRIIVLDKTIHLQVLSPKGEIRMKCNPNSKISKQLQEEQMTLDVEKITCKACKMRLDLEADKAKFELNLQEKGKKWYHR